MTKIFKTLPVVDQRGQKIESVNSELKDRSIECIQYKTTEETTD